MFMLIAILFWANSHLQLPLTELKIKLNPFIPNDTNMQNSSNQPT